MYEKKRYSKNISIFFLRDLTANIFFASSRIIWIYLSPNHRVLRPLAYFWSSFNEVKQTMRQGLKCKLLICEKIPENSSREEEK